METLLPLLVIVVLLGSIVVGIFWGLKSDSQPPVFRSGTGTYQVKVRPHVPGTNKYGRPQGTQQTNNDSTVDASSHMVLILDTSDTTEKSSCSTHTSCSSTPSCSTPSDGGGGVVGGD